MEVGVHSERRGLKVGAEWGCIGIGNRARQLSVTPPGLPQCLKRISTQASQDVPRSPGESRTLGGHCWGWEKGSMSRTK